MDNVVRRVADWEKNCRSIKSTVALSEDWDMFYLKERNGTFGVLSKSTFVFFLEFPMSDSLNNILNVTRYKEHGFYFSPTALSSHPTTRKLG